MTASHPRATPMACCDRPPGADGRVPECHPPHGGRRRRVCTPGASRVSISMSETPRRTGKQVREASCHTAAGGSAAPTWRGSRRSPEVPEPSSRHTRNCGPRGASWTPPLPAASAGSREPEDTSSPWLGLHRTREQVSCTRTPPSPTCQRAVRAEASCTKSGPRSDTSWQQAGAQHPAPAPTWRAGGSTRDPAAPPGTRRKHRDMTRSLGGQCQGSRGGRLAEGGPRPIHHTVALRSGGSGGPLA